MPIVPFLAKNPEIREKSRPGGLEVESGAVDFKTRGLNVKTDWVNFKTGGLDVETD